MTEKPDPIRKPRLGIMGEFSAGKSTLSNLLLGRRVLPEKVTATQLPPVWMTTGTDKPSRTTTDGQTHPILLDQLENISPEETRFIKINIEAEILHHCDIIDFPGISDPNMSSAVWERLLGEVDGVLWCTHATQAWRQSESSAWELIPEHVRQNSLLLITRFDKLVSKRDKDRVTARVARETSGLFADICPISLTQSLAAGNHESLRDASGASQLFDAIANILESLGNATARSNAQETPAKDDACKPAATPASDTTPEHAEVSSRPNDTPDAPVIMAEQTQQQSPAAIVPRRVTSNGSARTQRPSRSARTSSLSAI
ncbi:MAG: dynamin family protein [Sulfitobacter sp.]